MSIEIKLKTPIKKEGQETDTLTVREPKLKDRKVFEHLKFGEKGADISMGDMLDTALQAAQTLCGLTPLEAGELGIEDSIRLFEVTAGFFGDSETAGKTE